MKLLLSGVNAMPEISLKKSISCALHPQLDSTFRAHERAP